MRASNIKNLIVAAMCAALCVVLPMAFHAIPNAGGIFLPMHIPVLLCGRILNGILNALIFQAGRYSMQIWLAAAFTTALPGIVIQLVLIPSLLLVLEKAGALQISAKKI